MANDYSEDDCLEAWEFENGANLGEGSKGAIDLTNTNVTQDSVNFKVGLNAALSNASTDKLSIVDGSLPGDFPGKGTQRTFGVAFWMRPASVYLDNNSIFGHIASKYSVAGKRSWSVDQHNLDGTDRIRIVIGWSLGNNLESIYSEPQTFVSGQWYFVGVTYDPVTKNNHFRIWYNTEQTLSDSSSLGTQIMNIGDAAFTLFARDANGAAFEGQLDDASVWKRALSSRHIDDLRNGVYPGGDGVGAMMFGSDF